MIDGQRSWDEEVGSGSLREPESGKDWEVRTRGAGGPWPLRYGLWEMRGTKMVRKSLTC
jgi:hypothetical protein